MLQHKMDAPNFTHCNRPPSLECEDLELRISDSQAGARQPCTQEPTDELSTHVRTPSPLASITRLSLLPHHQANFGV